jgi:putative addiction module killer protein
MSTRTKAIDGSIRSNTIAAMYQIETTDIFEAWIQSLDKRTRIRIVSRLAKLATGLWGDYKAVGSGVTELREHFGSGYRIYVTQMDKVLVVALGGGDKSNQQKDVDRAIELASIVKAAQLKAAQTMKGNLP